MESAEQNITIKSIEAQGLSNLQIYSIRKWKTSKFEFFFELRGIRALRKRYPVSI